MRIVVRHLNRRVVSILSFIVVILFIAGGAMLSKCSDEPTTQQSQSSPKKKRSKSAKVGSITNAMSDFDQTAAFDREIESFMRRWELTGGSFALMRNDSLLYAKGYGYADKEAEERCEAYHTFRIASASKLITATAIMKLIEDGKLTLKSKVFGEEGILNDPMFLELKDSKLKLITVEHLLRHTAGFNPPVTDPAFSNYSVAKALGKSLPLTMDDMVLYATKYPLRGRPGDRYKYSNLGYIILGRVIEEVSGMDYERYVQRNIFREIGCDNIYIGANFEKDRDRNEVSYYEVKEAEEVYAYDGSDKMVLKSNGGNNVTLLGAAGGWVGSPAELLRFVSSIDGRGDREMILSKESIKAMSHDSASSVMKPMGWATVRGEEWIRSGSMAGTCTMIKRERNGYTWIFITNSSAWIGYRLSNNISSHISRAIGKVKGWPKQDLFEK